MKLLPVFLSVAVVVRNQATALEGILRYITEVVSGLATDYELIVVDNASEDKSVEILKNLTGEGGLPNLQVYALTREVDVDTASWAGVENSLGDFVAVIVPELDDIGFLPVMLEQAAGGVDTVFATNDQDPPQTVAYRVFRGFAALSLRMSGIRLARQAAQYRVLSKRVVNFILQHPMPVNTYRYLPSTWGFARVNLTYHALSPHTRSKRLVESIDRGMRLLVSTTRAPMRLVTSLLLFGAIANVIYSVYVVAVAILKEDVAPGWVTLSLQQSGMFFLMSLVLLLLAEYILHMASLSSEGPPYHVAQEFTSAVLTRRQKLNVENVVSSSRRGTRFSPPVSSE